MLSYEIFANFREKKEKRKVRPEAREAREPLQGQHDGVRGPLPLRGEEGTFFVFAVKKEKSLLSALCFFLD